MKIVLKISIYIVGEKSPAGNCAIDHNDQILLKYLIFVTFSISNRPRNTGCHICIHKKKITFHKEIYSCVSSKYMISPETLNECVYIHI